MSKVDIQLEENLRKKAYTVLLTRFLSNG